MNNGRDCPHGRQVGKCDTCDLITTELELEKVTAERDALAAQVAELSKYISIYEELQKLSPPQQNLVEIRSQAGRAGFIEGVEWQLYNYNEPTNKIDAADKYADSIRSEMSETDYLMSSPENAERLMRSIQQVKDRK